MIDTYFNGIIVKNKNKILENSRLKYEIDKSIDTLNSFIYYLEGIKDNKDSTNKDKVIKNMLYYLSHQTEDFVSSLVIGNFHSIMVLQRTLLETYFKLIFIINSDEYIATLFLDFGEVSMYNFTQLGDIQKRLPTKDQDVILKNYKGILNKYELPENKKYTDDYWIYLSLIHLDYPKADKTLRRLLEYIIDKKYVNKSLQEEYKNCCDFIHSTHNAITLTIYKGAYPEDSLIHSAISDFHYILYDILDNIEKKIDSSSYIANYKDIIGKNYKNILDNKENQ